MGNSAFFIALIIVSALALIFYKKKPRSFKILIVSFFILDLIIIGAIFDVEKVKQRLSETSLQSETRDEVVRDSIPLILEKPFLGHGTKDGIDKMIDTGARVISGADEEIAELGRRYTNSQMK